MENLASENISLFKLNAVLDQILDYIQQHPDFLETPGIFRETGDPLIVSEAFSKLSSDPFKYPITSLSENFLSNPHHISGIYKYFISTIKEPFTLNNKTSVVLELFIKKIMIYQTLPDQEQQSLNISSLIQKLINSNAVDEGKFIYNHLHLCELISQHEKNRISLKNAVLILCGSDFQKYVFAMQGEEDLMTNLYLQSVILRTIQEKDRLDYTLSFEASFPQKIDQSSSKKEKIQFKSPSIEKNIDVDATESIHSVDKEKKGGFFANLKNKAEKTISDFSSKNKQNAPQETQKNKTGVTKAKDLTAYKEQMLSMVTRTKKTVKEIVALSLNKDIPMDFEEERVEDLFTFSSFLSKVENIKAHLDDYVFALENDQKEDIPISKAICKQDQEEIERLIRDIEKEFNLIYKGFQSGESINALSEHLIEVMERKWRPLVSIKEMDDYEVICPHDEFDVKFERILSLHIGIELALQSMKESEE